VPTSCSPSPGSSGLPLWFFLLPPPGGRLAGADEDLDGLEPGAALEAVFGWTEGWREYEDRLLAETTLPAGSQPPVEPWVLERVRAAADRGFGSPASAADALRRVHTLLDVLDDPPAPLPTKHF